MINVIISAVIGGVIGVVGFWVVYYLFSGGHKKEWQISDEEPRICYIEKNSELDDFNSSFEDPDSKEQKYVLLLSPTVDYITTHSGDTREWVTDSHHIPFQITDYNSEFAWLIDHEGTPQFTSWTLRDNYVLTQRQIDRINSQFGFDLNEIKVAV